MGEYLELARAGDDLTPISDSKTWDLGQILDGDDACFRELEKGGGGRGREACIAGFDPGRLARPEAPAWMVPMTLIASMAPLPCYCMRHMRRGSAFLPCHERWRGQSD